jgi:integral membrane protein (TIGR01906 family)
MTNAELIEANQPRRLLLRLAHLYLVIIFPVLLVLISARIVMTPGFLEFEYNREGFPEDVYGLTREQRLYYGPFAVEYLLNDADISFLGDLEFSDGSALFNARELRHMRDVKLLTQVAFGFGAASGLLALIAAILIRRRSRDLLRRSLMLGALLTLGIVAAIIVVALVNWDFFFTGFHRLFFEGGTWYFLYSDTLIRLFPEQFWFDAALAVGGITVVGALTALLAAWLAGRDIRNT